MFCWWAMGVCKALLALAERRWVLSAEPSAVLLNLSWVWLWDDCFMAVLLSSTDVKWWNREAFGYLSYCLGCSRRSRGDGWTRTGAEGCIRTRGGCIKRYCTPAAVQLQLLCFLCCVQALHTVKTKQIWAYPCIFVLNTCWGGQWSRNSYSFGVYWHRSGSEIVHLATVEMLSLPQRLYSVLCPEAAGTNDTEFNKQALSWLFIWVTEPLGETWKKLLCCLEKGKLSHMWFRENQQSYCPVCFPPDFLMSDPAKHRAAGKGPREHGGHSKGWWSSSWPKRTSNAGLNREVGLPMH